jgi:hypothetical protein
MPINIDDYEEDGPAFAWHEHPEEDCVYYDGDFLPYDGPYEEIRESFGRAGPSRDAVEPAGEATESTGRAGPSSDVVEPAGGGLSDPRIDIVGHKCIKVPTNPDDECRICMDTFHDASNPAVSALVRMYYTLNVRKGSSNINSSMCALIVEHLRDILPWNLFMVGYGGST